MYRRSFFICTILACSATASVYAMEPMGSALDGGGEVEEMLSGANRGYGSGAFTFSGSEPTSLGIVRFCWHYEPVSRELIQRAIRIYRQPIRTCYEDQLRRDPSLTVRVTTAFRIVSSGEVEDISLLEVTEGTPKELASCLIEVIRGISFPEWDGASTVRVVYPFSFQPAEHVFVTMDERYPWPPGFRR